MHTYNYMNHMILNITAEMITHFMVLNILSKVKNQVLTNSFCLQFINKTASFALYVLKISCCTRTSLYFANIVPYVPFKFTCFFSFKATQW